MPPVRWTYSIHPPPLLHLPSPCSPPTPPRRLSVCGRTRFQREGHLLTAPGATAVRQAAREGGGGGGGVSLLRAFGKRRMLDEQEIRHRGMPTVAFSSSFLLPRRWQPTTHTLPACVCDTHSPVAVRLGLPLHLLASFSVFSLDLLEIGFYPRFLPNFLPPQMCCPSQIPTKFGQLDEHSSVFVGDA